MYYYIYFFLVVLVVGVVQNVDKYFSYYYIYHFFVCETTVNNLGITHVFIHSLSTEVF